MTIPKRMPDACFDGRWSPKPKDIERAQARSEQAINRYLRLASSGSDVSGAFMGAIAGKKQRHWYLDGVEVDTKIAKDPWAARVVRVEPIGMVVGNWPIKYRAQWRALAADGSTLGIYDGFMQTTIRGAQIYDLKLYSPGSTARPEPMTPFCNVPGDLGVR